LCRNTVEMRLMEDSTQTHDSGTFSLYPGERNGLAEQRELLSQLSVRLDEYFALRNLGTPE